MNKRSVMVIDANGSDKFVRVELTEAIIHKGRDLFVADEGGDPDYPILEAMDSYPTDTAASIMSRGHKTICVKICGKEFIGHLEKIPESFMDIKISEITSAYALLIFPISVLFCGMFCESKLMDGRWGSNKEDLIIKALLPSERASKFSVLMADMPIRESSVYGRIADLRISTVINICLTVFEETSNYVRKLKMIKTPRSVQLME